MLMALIILFTFLSRTSKRIAAIVGGIGFGTFLDEVGKFVTQDNDYFFQPSIAIMYTTFILILILIRSIQTGKAYSSQEYILNAIKELEEVVLHDLDQHEKKRALYLLEKSRINTPLVQSLKKVLDSAELVSDAQPGHYVRLKNKLVNLYAGITDLSIFSKIIVSFFVIQFLIKFSYVFAMVFLRDLNWDQILTIQLFGTISQKMLNLTFIDWAELTTSILAGIFTVLGILYIRFSKILSYRMFERSILVHLFLTQVFTFYKKEFTALFGLTINILIYAGLRFMINRELMPEKLE